MGPSIKDVRKIWPTFDPPPSPVSTYFGLLQAKINSNVRFCQTPLRSGCLLWMAPKGLVGLYPPLARYVQRAKRAERLSRGDSVRSGNNVNFFPVKGKISRTGRASKIGHFADFFMDGPSTEGNFKVFLNSWYRRPLRITPYFEKNAQN